MFECQQGLWLETAKYLEAAQEAPIVDKGVLYINKELDVELIVVF